MPAVFRFYLPSLIGALLLVLVTALMLRHEHNMALLSYHRLFTLQLSSASLLLQQAEPAQQVLGNLSRLHHGQLSLLERAPTLSKGNPDAPLFTLDEGGDEPMLALFAALPDGRWLKVAEPRSTVLAAHGLARYGIWALACTGALILLALTLRARRTRLRMLENEVLYRQILDHLPVQVRVRDTQGQMRFHNHLAAEAAACTRADLPLDQESPLLGVNAYEAWRGLREVRRTGQTQERYFRRGQVANEAFASYRLIAFPIHNGAHELAALGTVVVDETRLSMSREAFKSLMADLENQVQQRTLELANARDAAEAAARAKADFLANMSHEIRSPLNAVIGLAHLAARANGEPRVQAYLDKILSSAGHLQVVINGILDYSKIGAGKMVIERVPFSPEQLLEGLADMYWERAQAKELALLFDVDPRLPEQLYGDPLRISQILYNFTDNAIKFTASGVVSVRVLLVEHQQEQWTLRFEVQDSGIGIDPSQLSRVFEPFEQIHGAQRQGGTGLGLPICRQFAELMGGALEARSQPGEGSLFSLTLTLGAASEAAPAILCVSDSRRALLADHDHHSRTRLSGMLAAIGLHVTAVDSADTLLAQLEPADGQQCPFALLFVDWNLADMAAGDLVEHIRQRQLAPNTQVVLLGARGSSHQMPADMLELYDAVLDQPVVPQRLREVVLRLQRDETPAGLSGRHVLLVENERLNQEVARELLEALKLRVTVAGDGVQALAALDAGSDIDLVLMDVQMPVMGGLEATCLLRQRWPELPVIAMTGESLPGDRERCLAAGMNDYLAKPILPAELAQCISRWLNQHAPLGRLAEPMPAPTLRIDGLEVGPALERLMGNETLYRRLLARFLSDYQNVDQPMQAAIAAGDFEAARAQAHSFKSLAATLGAETLRQLTEALEQALAHQHGLAEFAVFEGELNRVRQAIAQALDGH